MAITAIILAAGRGSRLNVLTENCPKGLTKLGDTSLIERQVAVLKAAGIEDIVIVSGYRGEMLDLPGTRRIENTRWETTNMVESLFAAKAAFGNDLIVSYGDIVYEPCVLSALLQSPNEILVAVDQQWREYWEQRFDDPLSDAESLKVDGQGRIMDIGNPVDDIEKIQAQYIGLMRFRGVGIEALKKARADLGSIPRTWMQKRPVEQAYMTDLLMELILTGTAVHAVPIDGGWLEIDTEKDLVLATELMSPELDGPLRTASGSRGEN